MWNNAHRPLPASLRDHGGQSGSELCGAHELWLPQLREPPCPKQDSIPGLLGGQG